VWEGGGCNCVHVDVLVCVSFTPLQPPRRLLMSHHGMCTCSMYPDSFTHARGRLLLFCTQIDDHPRRRYQKLI